jgi:ubiquitin-like 1-activating enzyme E1 B
VQDMWKSRRPPEPLKYGTVLSQAQDALASQEAVLRDDQKAWSLEESLVVFNNSIDRLSRRWMELKKAKEAGSPDPIITFDKDDIDTLDFVAASANIRSIVFGIERKSRFDIKQMAGNIIPAIATTNAIVAGLCVIESLKLLKDDYAAAKEVFITPFAPARLLAPDKSRQANADCPVCGVHYLTLTVDLERATLEDLVESFLRQKLGYKDKDIVVNNDVGILYDADETDNLSKKLTELGIKNGSFLTVIDEDDDDPVVNVVITIQKGSLASEDSPIKAPFSEAPELTRKAKKLEHTESNGNGEKDGAQHSLDGDGQPGPKGTKRPLAEDEDQPAKKVKLTATDESDDVVVIEDAGGAIVIDDD